MSAILSVENLTVSYGSDSTPVVDNISFKLLRGQCLGLIGESGCGKTTTARAISGLTPYQGGSIQFNDKEIEGPHPSIQMVFQDHSNSLNPRMTILQNIIEPLRYLGITTRDAMTKGQALMEQVGVDLSRSNDYPHAFSGGQLQRISIARALAPEPELIICDEPVSALDLSIQAQILELLKTIQTETGIALLFVSHDLSVVRYLCPESVVMASGKILEKGSTQDILDQPQHPETKALVQAIPKWTHNQS
jgi:ABC-type dipeptide/oligopeptide/nickel transport system ATPase subunit